MSNEIYIITCVALLFFAYLIRELKISSILLMIFGTLVYIDLMIISENDIETIIAMLCLIMNVSLNVVHFEQYFSKSEE